MPKFTRFKLFISFLATVALLSACSPKYNWREVHGKDGSFTALLPDKPVSIARKITLGDQQVEMTMTAAEVDGVSFAIGYAQLADAKSAAAALSAMKEAMVRNINGTVKTTQSPSTGSTSASAQANVTDIEAVGTPGGKEPLLLLGHFTAKGNRVFQAIVLGDEKAVPREEANTFLASFKPN